MKKILLAVAIMSVALGASAEKQWKMATPYGAGQLHDKTNHYFAEQLAEKTQGKIQIEIYPGEKLVEHSQILAATRNNTVQLGEVLISRYGHRQPLWAMDSLPFLANSYEKARKLWAATRGPIAEDLDKKNLVLLYSVPWPGQNFYSKGKIDNIGYFEGKTIRVYNDVLAKVTKNLKAIPKRTKIKQGIESGKLDILITSPSTGVAYNMWEYMGHYTKVNAFFPKQMVFINKDEWGKLDATTQKAVREAAKSAEAYGWSLSKTEHAGKEAELIDNGMVSEEPNADVKQTLFRLGQKMVVDWRKKADKRAKDAMRLFRGY